MDERFGITFGFTNPLLVLATAILAYGCSGKVELETQRFPIDSAAARHLGDQVAKDLEADNRDALRERMESAFTNTVSAKEFDDICNQMVEIYGRPIEFEFKQEELGSKFDAHGATTPMRKFWYAAKTTKYDKGSHFLIVEIIRDQGEVAVSSFAIVNFPLGVPETLK